MKEADLALAGGGVLCIALAGVIEELAKDGHKFVRIVANSGGSFTGALLASMESTGHNVAEDLVDTILNIPFETFNDVPAPLPFKPFVMARNLSRRGGLIDGNPLQQWMAAALREFGIRNFGDLRLPERYCAELPPARHYRLAVAASDISSHRPIMLPWDYGDFGVDPDTQSVSEAVRMSVSVPYFFTPVPLKDADGSIHSIVDGGVFTNYPAQLLDSPADRRPDRPVLGANLFGVMPRDGREIRPVKGPMSLGRNLTISMLGACDAAFLDEPRNVARTVSVPTSGLGINPLDFNLSDRNKQLLVDSGRRAAHEFLKTWDFDGYCQTHYPPLPRQTVGEQE